jgi:hypothetical protein
MLLNGFYQFGIGEEVEGFLHLSNMIPTLYVTQVKPSVKNESHTQMESDMKYTSH